MDAEVKLSIVDCYKEYFYTTVANTEELKKEAYRLRYKVFIEELSFSSFEYQNNEEKDAFDKFSFHSLLYHKKNNQLVGCTRLVPYIKQFTKNPLPFLKYCHYPEVFKQLDTNKVGELTRLAIAPEFRSRYQDQDRNSEPKTSINKNLDRRKLEKNFLAICITVASINLLRYQNFTHGVAFIEPKLSILLKRFGIVMNEIGEEVIINGKRKPYLIDTEASYINFSPIYKELFSIISNEFSQS